jgi:hypothetical protein
VDIVLTFIDTKGIDHAYSFSRSLPKSSPHMLVINMTFRRKTCKLLRTMSERNIQIILYINPCNFLLLNKSKLVTAKKWLGCKGNDKKVRNEIILAMMPLKAKQYSWQRIG